MPPYRLPQQPQEPQQQQAEGSEQGPPHSDSNLHEAATDALAPEDTAAKGSEGKEGCRVRAASSEPPLCESHGRTAAEEEQRKHQGHQQQQQQTASKGEPPVEKTEPLKRPPLCSTNASAQCSTGAPSPPEAEANALLFREGQHRQPEAAQQQAVQMNGVEETVGEQQPHSEVTSSSAHHPQQQELPQQQDRRRAAEAEGYGMVAPMPARDWDSELAEHPFGESPRERQQLVLEGGALAALPPEPYLQPIDAAAAAVAPQTTEAAPEYHRREAKRIYTEEAPASQQVVAIPLQQRNAEEGLLNSDQEIISSWSEQQQDQQAQQQHQQPPQHRQCAELPPQHDVSSFREPGGSSSSSCTTGASPKLEGHLRRETDAQANLRSRNSPKTSPQGATASAAVAAASVPVGGAPAPTDAREQPFHRAASLHTGEAKAKASSHRQTSKVWGSSLSRPTSLQQEQHLLREQQEGQEHHKVPQDVEQQRQEEQLQLLPQQQYPGQQQLHQGLFMEDILPGFARAVQDLEKSSAETLRQLAALQQQVGVLRSRNACLTSSIQQVTEQLLTGEGPMVERQRAAELLQDALEAAAAEFPSPIGDDSELQPSPTYSAVSDAEAALEEAQGAVSAVRPQLLASMLYYYFIVAAQLSGGRRHCCFIRPHVR